VNYCLLTVFGAPEADGAVLDYMKKSHNLKTPKAAVKNQRSARNKPAAVLPVTPSREVISHQRPPQMATLSVPVATYGGRSGMLPPPTTTMASRPEQRLAAMGPVPLSYSSDFSTGADHYFDSHVEYYPAEGEQVKSIKQ
jgi:hypothetical protein